MERWLLTLTDLNASCCIQLKDAIYANSGAKRSADAISRH